jgi:hypothetical protein
MRLIALIRYSSPPIIQKRHNAWQIVTFHIAEQVACVFPRRFTLGWNIKYLPKIIVVGSYQGVDRSVTTVASFAVLDLDSPLYLFAISIGISFS